MPPPPLPAQLLVRLGGWTLVGRVLSQPAEFCSRLQNGAHLRGAATRLDRPNPADLNTGAGKLHISAKMLRGATNILRSEAALALLRILRHWLVWRLVLEPDHQILVAYSFVIKLKTNIIRRPSMAQTTMTVRLNETLSDFVAANVGERGAYENVSEYMRDLIRRDMERVEREAFDRLKAELAQAYAAPESAYKPLTAADVTARNRV